MAEEPRRGPPVVEIVLPSYITKPAEDEKFYPSEVKAVAEKVSKRNCLSLCFIAQPKDFIVLLYSETGPLLWCLCCFYRDKGIVRSVRLDT